jgi:hypothetical protein
MYEEEIATTKTEIAELERTVELLRIRLMSVRLELSALEGADGRTPGYRWADQRSSRTRVRFGFCPCPCPWGPRGFSAEGFTVVALFGDHCVPNDADQAAPLVDDGRTVGVPGAHPYWSWTGQLRRQYGVTCAC